MRRRSLILLMAFSAPLPSLALAAGCGNTIVIDDDPGSNGGAGGGWHPSTSTSSNGGADGGKDALDEFQDPGCPDADPPPTQFSCDPFNQDNGDCPPGEGCYIFVQYPDPGTECGQEIYGSLCAPEGFGGQGSPCGGGQDCQGGFVCVVTGAGNQCVQLCPVTGADNCPPGLVCEPIDVEGFGGCL